MGLCECGFIKHLAKLDFILDAEEIFEKPETRLGEDRLRMKLHSLDAQLAMPKAHDRSVIRLGRNFQLARQRFPLDDQRMVACGLKFLRQASKNRFAIVIDAARFAVHQFARSNHSPPKRRPDRLMAQANTENRNFAREALNQWNADCRFLWRVRTGRHHEALTPPCLDLVERNSIVATHFELLPHLAQVLSQVISKGIVVVE